LIIIFTAVDGEANDQIRMKDYYSDHNGSGFEVGMYNRKIEEFIFADGEVWSSADIESRSSVYHGSDDDDWMPGGSYKENVLHGRKGNDIIRGDFDKGNELHGDEGDDKIYGMGYDDKIYGGEGNDTIKRFRAGGDDIFYGNEGNDTIHGGKGDDVIHGGKGDDILRGGLGSDTYVYNKGDGQDTIYLKNGHFAGMKFDMMEGIVKDDSESYDTIQLNDINFTDIKEISRTDEDLVIAFNSGHEGSTDSITLKEWFRFNSLTESDTLMIEDIIFADGTKLDFETISDSLAQKGTASADTITGTSGDDWIRGLDGDDILEGGQGSDLLEGGLGNDTYLYSRKDGNDIVFDHGNGSDKLQFSDILTSDVNEIIKHNLDLIIVLNATDEYQPNTVKILNWYKTSDANQESNHKIEQIIFADNTIWSVDDIENKAVIYGDELGSIIVDDERDNIIIGKDKSDDISSNIGDDTITAGAGNDFIT